MQLFTIQILFSVDYLINTFTRLEINFPTRQFGGGKTNVQTAHIFCFTWFLMSNYVFKNVSTFLNTDSEE